MATTETFDLLVLARIILTLILRVDGVLVQTLNTRDLTQVRCLSCVGAVDTGRTVLNEFEICGLNLTLAAEASDLGELSLPCVVNSLVKFLSLRSGHEFRALVVGAGLGAVFGDDVTLDQLRVLFDVLKLLLSQIYQILALALLDTPQCPDHGTGQLVARLLVGDLHHPLSIVVDPFALVGPLHLSWGAFDLGLNIVAGVEGCVVLDLNSLELFRCVRGPEALQILLGQFGKFVLLVLIHLLGVFA
ncbi:hypothetical protein HG530_004337 [Fusarium avenaceum]|nr:hypothetical protein HG530_004337 [Fusarium avenaceum]